MPSKSRVYRHVFQGGYATELGTLANIAADEGARVEIPFLTRAENIFFTLSGGIRKIGGTTVYNGTVLEAGAHEIRGIFEYVKQGTAGSPTRKRIAVCSTTIKKDDNDGSFSNIFTGIADDSVPCFTVFEDELIISTDADEAPRTYDQSTATTLGGSPPNFAWATVHANRVWAGGDPANPSRLHYSGLLDSTDWNGATNSGYIDVDPDDGDVLTGARPFRGELIAFKGPNFGSIHRIQGLVPADFERRVLAQGVGAAGHNLIFDLGTDLGFVAQDGSIRSLLATADFGDYRTAAMSREIETFLARITFSSLKRGWAVTDTARGYSLFALPIDTATSPNSLLMMDTRFGRPRFAVWTAVDASCLARMSDASNSNQPIIYAGGSDGYIRKIQQNSRTIDDDGAIAAYARTPYIDYGSPLYKKTMRGIGLSIEPKGDYDITVAYRHKTSSSVLLSQSGGAVLGQFVLGQDVLGGARSTPVFAEVFDAGDFRAVSYEISNIVAEEDFEVQALHVVMEGAASESYEG